MDYRSNIVFVCLVAFVSLNNGCNSSNVSPSSRKPRVTLESFNKIDEGMTMEQVIAILGDGSTSTIDSTIESGAQRMTLVDVKVSQVAVFNDDSTGDSRKIEIGFNDGKVAAVIYRDGKVVKMKPEVPADRFRLIVEQRPSGILRVVVDFESPEGKLMAFGVGESMDRLDGFGAATPQKNTTFTVRGRLVDNTDAERRSLEVVLQLLGPKTTSTSTSNFAVGEGKRLSDVLAWDINSGLYKPGKPIRLGIITGKDGKTQTIILHVTEKQENSDEGQ